MTSRSSELPVTVTHPTFEEWWQPYLHGVGPAGEVIAALDPDRRREVEQALRRNLGDGPFDITAVAWAGRGGREPRPRGLTRPRRVSSSGRRATAARGRGYCWSVMMRSLLLLRRRSEA